VFRQGKNGSSYDKKVSSYPFEGITIYMSIIGCPIWIQGVRLDIILAVSYLSWYTKSTHQHHINVAYYCVGYLGKTSKLPLVQIQIQ
jgi:hypothetical protein